MTESRLFDDGAPRRYSLVRLAADLARSLAQVGTIVVEGEVHRPTARYGRTYLVLKDRAAQINVMCPPSRATRCRTVEGERVAVTGKLIWLNDRGAVQLVADEVVPVGAGAVAAAVAETRARLGADGLLDRARRELPLLPAGVGVICGAEAAVRADIESVVEERFPGFPVHFLEVGVAGAAAADRMIEALGALESRADIDVIILARGGGDSTQMLPFSDELLCRAVAGCSKPVVSAIGHHADTPLCDEVADRRCATPSVAAAAVVPARLELDRRLTELGDRRVGSLRAMVVEGENRLREASPASALDTAMSSALARMERSQNRIGDLTPQRSLAGARQRLSRVGWRDPVLGHARRGRERVAASRRQMEALSPQRVLERGYAIVRTDSGAVARDVQQLARGERLEVQLARGRAITRVEETQQ